MMRWTINTNNCDLIGDYYFEKEWHTPDAPKATLPAKDNTNVRFFNNEHQLTLNYNYAIVPFVKAFISSKPVSELDAIHTEHGNSVWMPNWTKVVKEYLGFFYAPADVTLPTDEELGKNLVSGLYLGSWSKSNRWSPWNNYAYSGWPYDITPADTGYGGYNYIQQSSIVNTLKADSLGTDVSVTFNENSSPAISDSGSYQAPGLFIPLAFGNGKDTSNLISGIVIVLGVKAVEA